MNKVMIIVAILVVLTTTAAAQSFAISGMWGSSPVVLNGQAATGNGVVRVAPALTSSKGSIFYNSMLSVENGFDTTFTFKITVPVGGAGADGLAFVIHGDPRGSSLLTNHAAALGYGAFATSPAGTGAFNALAIEIDTYSGSFNGYSDSGANEISVHTNGINEISQGENHSIGRINLSTAVANFSDGLSHSLRVLYVPGTLDIFVDGGSTPVLSIPYSMTTGGTQVLTGSPVGGLGLSGGMAWVGFTASCGGVTEHHDVSAWSFASSAPPTWPGNATAFACEPSVNGVASGNATGVVGVAAGDLVGLHFQADSLAGEPFSAYYQLFTTGASLISAVIPGETPPGGFWLDLGNTNPAALTGIVPFLDGLGLGGGVFLSPVMPLGGYDYGFIVPAVLGGQNVSIFIQGLISDPGLNAYGLGIGDCLELQVL